MKANKSANASIWVVSIHDREPQGDQLSFDTKDVLDCLGPNIRDYAWIITDLDCTAEEAESLCDAVEKSRRRGEALVLSWEELFAACSKIKQTLEATIIGIPHKEFSTKELEDMKDLSRFPRDCAELVIRAIDSSFFEVITKKYDHVEAINGCFKDVRAEEPANYFAP
jgi:hypothetical protein